MNGEFCGEKGLRKHAFWGRLEKVRALNRGWLRAFLIAAQPIKK
jgi:hypothetical protein